jgi:hypothetical protein
MVSYSTWMVSYSSPDADLQQTGWVKIIAGTAAGRCSYILLAKKKLLAVSVVKGLYFWRFLFFSETSL